MTLGAGVKRDINPEKKSLHRRTVYKAIEGEKRKGLIFRLPTFDQTPPKARLYLFQKKKKKQIKRHCKTQSWVAVVLR